MSERAVEIALSPLEPFLGKLLEVTTPGETYSGRLASFGAGWLLLTSEPDRRPFVLYTGPGCVVLLHWSEEA